MGYQMPLSEVNWQTSAINVCTFIHKIFNLFFFSVSKFGVSAGYFPWCLGWTSHWILPLVFCRVLPENFFYYRINLHPPIWLAYLPWDLRLLNRFLRSCILVYIKHLKPVPTYPSNSYFYFPHVSAVPCFYRSVFLLCCQISLYFPLLILTLVYLLKSFSLIHVFKSSSEILSNTFIVHDVP